MKVKIPFTNYSFGLSSEAPIEAPIEASNVNSPPLGGFGLIPRQELQPWNGNKFSDSFGPTVLHLEDYWSLRQRSKSLFMTNLYAMGIVNRYVTNIINTGLFPELDPQEEILGMTEGDLDDWADMVENRFELWGENPKMCDYEGKFTFGKIQRIGKLSALVAGDVLEVMRYVRGQDLPLIQLVDADKIQTPIDTDIKLRKGHDINQGVELDARGRQVAYWIAQKDGSSKRLAAFDRRTGRPVAKLIYGVPPKLGQVRGTPLLGIILQSLKEMDKYRDSAQRSAAVQSLLAMFVEKEQDIIGSNPMTNGAVRTGTQRPTAGSEEFDKAVPIMDGIPGMVAETLNVGEKIRAFTPTGAPNFKEFEDVIVSAMSWALETPPEIMKLAFGSNYAAAQAANSEFKMFLNKERTDFGHEFCSMPYIEWFTSEVLLRKISADGFIQSINNPDQYDIYGAWTKAQWSGAIKPSSDIVKTGNGYKTFVDEGWISRARASRETTGTKFSRNVRRLKRENEMLADARRPLLEMEEEVAAENAPAIVEVEEETVEQSA